MDSEAVEVTIKRVMPTNNGCAIFLGPADKTIIMYVEQNIGTAIANTLVPTKKERPLTHDLIGDILLGLEASIQRVIINDAHPQNGTFFALIIIKMENELGTKWIEIDARPSDSIVLALQARKPILIARKVLDASDDMTEVLERILQQEN